MTRLTLKTAPLRITPIGSCRIATPLRRGAERYGFEVSRGGVYGYCHSSSEAVQMARHLQGEFAPDDAFWPFVSTLDERPEPHEGAEIYVVELSSSKRIELDGKAVQLNYLMRHAPEVFQNRPLARAFWRMADRGDSAGLLGLLAPRLPRDDKRLHQLSRIKRKVTSADDLRRDMAELSDRLGRVLFVTHVDARPASGQAIEARVQFQMLLKRVARQMGAMIYDPTDRMRYVGQAAAIEDQSSGLAHFTDQFSDAVMDDWAGGPLSGWLIPMPVNMDADNDGGLWQAARYSAFDDVAEAEALAEAFARCPKTAASALAEYEKRKPFDTSSPISREEIAAHLPSVERTLLKRALGEDDWLHDIDVRPSAVADLLRSLIAQADDQGVREVLGRLVQGDYADLKPLLTVWLEDDCGDALSIERVRTLASVLKVVPGLKPALDEMTSARNALISQMRAAVTTAELSHLAQISRHLARPVPAVYAALCRAHLSEQNYEQALSVGEEAVAALPDNLTLWVTLMRAAAVVDDPRLPWAARHVLHLAQNSQDGFAREAQGHLGLLKVAV